MFVAVDEENKQVFGPFDSQEKGEDWARAYVRKEALWSATDDEEQALHATEFDISIYMWNVHEVQFVDQDDRTFAEFFGEPAWQGSFEPGTVHTFLAPNNARPTLCARVFTDGSECGLPQPNPIHNV